MLTFVEIRQKLDEAKFGPVKVKLPRSADGDHMMATFDTKKGVTYEISGASQNAGKQNMPLKDLKALGFKIPKNKNDLKKLMGDLNDMFM